MGIFSSKSSIKQIKRDDMATALYEFSLPAYEGLSDVLRNSIIDDKSVFDCAETESKFKFECIAMATFLITNTFKTVCESDGQNEGTYGSVLVGFHDILLKKIGLTLMEDNIFRKTLQERYREYHPIIEEDLVWVNRDTKGQVIPFRGIVEAFFKKVAPQKTRSPDLLTFCLTFTELYSSISNLIKQIIKEYEII